MNHARLRDARRGRVKVELTLDGKDGGQALGLFPTGLVEGCGPGDMLGNTLGGVGDCLLGDAEGGDDGATIRLLLGLFDGCMLDVLLGDVLDRVEG